MTTAIKASLCLSATSAALLACVACSGPGNSGLNPPDEALIDEMPWLNGGVPHLDESDPTKPVIKTSRLPVYPPIGQNLVDPGSAPIQDCYKEALYEFAPWVATGEPIQVAEAADSTDPADLAGLAIRWAGADDNTRGSWRTPGFATWYPELAAPSDANKTLLNPIIWGTPAQSTSDVGSAFSVPFPGAFLDANGVAQPGLVPNCNRNPDGTPKVANNYVIHMRGAGFRYYGGNIAHILAGDNYPGTDPDNPANTFWNDCPKNPDGSNSSLCHPEYKKGDAENSAGFPTAPTKNDVNNGVWQLGALHTYFDVSGYEGVSFWARRGPESMGTLLVTIADKYTSDDMNRQNEKFCRRIFGCYSECQNGSVCSKTDAETDATGGALYRCFDPKNGKIPSPDPNNVSAASDLVDEAYPRCNPHNVPKDPITHTYTHGSACTFRSTYPDADFEGKECRPWTFTSGESGEYCFNADDPPPPSREERCNDGFTSMLQLTEDWQFYTVPFSDMRQGGYGKIAPEFDLKSVYSVTLGWGSGNMDIYLDNVSLYKTK